SEDSKHRVYTGHQLRAFTGIKFENKEASLSQCDQVQDNDFIRYNETPMRWRDVKLSHPYSKWNFAGVASDQVASLRVNSRQGVTAFHYILLLDRSGSMSGANWDNLMIATKALIKGRIESGADDRITIIPFDDHVVHTDIFTNQKMNDINTNNIRFTGGGTEFGQPLQVVINVLSQLRNNNITPHLRTIILFISDGGAGYPKQQLDVLAPQVGQDIAEFWTVTIGGQNNMHKQINDRMQGTLKLAIDPTTLKAVFAEIIADRNCR
ncbi:unnamed protein product, partial [Didymodactylos carnosus]